MAANGEAPDEGGMRRRHSTDHNAGAVDGRDSRDDGMHTGVHTLSGDDARIIQNSATDLPIVSGARRTSLEQPPRVRFSADVARPTTAPTGKRRKSNESGRDHAASRRQTVKPPALCLNTATANAKSGASFGVLDKPIVTSPAGLVPPRSGNMSPRSPSSPRARNRGLSLRSSLFTRNLDRRSHTGDSIIEMQETASSSNDAGRPRTSKKSSDISVVVSPVEEMENSLPIRIAPSRKGAPLRLSTTLPNYNQWVQEQAKRRLPIKRMSAAYRQVRKFVLRIKEMPPSKEGRHISVDPSRKTALVDERTGHPYVKNFVRSSKYTAWNFLPRQLFAQFSKLANFYFLIVSILQMIPGLSTTGTFTTIIPLLFFVTISIAKEGIEDLRRYRYDKVENNREADVLHAYRPVLTPDNDEAESGFSANSRSQAAMGPIHWAKTKWQTLQVGDIIKLERNDMVPADIMLLSSKGNNSIAYVETMALDGETNLKTKQPSPALAGLSTTPEAVAALENTHVIVEDPNLDLYNLDGKIVVKGGDTAPLTNNEIIYRGSVLRNTSQAIGMVIYSGEECKIRMNANKNPRIKAPSLQAIVNKIVVCMVIFVITLALFNTIAYQIWSATTEKESWYLTAAKVPFGQILISFIIMFNTMIPLSLYVSLEIIKVAQMLLLNDVDMYDEVSNTPFEARTSTINEELGQVSYIFTDKTGTLTENVMRFRKLSVAGTAWLHDTHLKDQPSDAELLLHKKRKQKDKRPLRKIYRKSHTHREGSNLDVESQLDHVSESSGGKPMSRWRSSAMPNIGQPELTTAQMVQYIQRRPHTVFAQKARMMILSLALCHTCLPEQNTDGGDDAHDDDQVSFQSSSPDELALVQAAQELGYLAYNREISTLTLKIYPQGKTSEPVFEEYQILDVIEFSSKRKRMSVVVRFPDGRVCVICKGADSVIMDRLRLAGLANQKAAEIERRVYERKSMEAEHVLARRNSMVERQGSIASFPRASMSIRRSSIGIGRSSVGRIAASRHEIDDWLNEREHEFTPKVDATHYSPRPSTQLGRPSAAYSEHHPTSLYSEPEDDFLVEESLVTNDGAVFERCFQHINDFATEGLRTLLYSYRFLDDEDYRSWKKIYHDAATSLVDRQELIEQAGELIEQCLELCGATAIEDKLQQGVPETIDRLRRANIKTWMLTGDKRETAINIGHSCHLIKDYSSVTILDYEAGNVEQSIAATVIDINQGTLAHAVVVVDGQTLGMISSEESLNTLFLDLAILADAVICCRASPSQKAALVHAIRKRVNRSVTLAIGDGANDIAMIQEAHVGIGITGKEGLQAARTSDYSIAQFRFLTKLLLVHGRWNYIRTCKYTLGTFWKEMLFYLTQALYQRWNGYTGTSLYEQWSLSMFNTLFTSLPVIFLGVFEKDLAASTLIAVPELYTKGQRSGGFNFKVYLSWVFMAASEAMIVFFTMRGLFGQALFTFDNGLFAMGDMTFTVCIILINSKLQLLEQRYKSIMAVVCMFLEVFGWFLWNLILSVIYQNNQEYNVKGGFLDRFGRNPLWWLCVVLTVSSCILFEIAVRALKNLLFPTDVEIFAELEKDHEVRRRFEEASASELQAGWNHGTPRSSLELKQEVEMQAKRESEVLGLLGRPRVMEEPHRNGPGATAANVVELEEQEVLADDVPRRRSTDVHEVLSRRFGSIRKGSLNPVAR